MKTSFTFCLLFVFCLGVLNTIKAQVDVQDSLALVDLYNSTNGTEWKRNDNWLTGPVKDWSGIILTGDGKRVSKIYLPDNNLNGSISSSLGNLASLWYLNLSDNQLSGSIPPELGNILNLIWLDFSENKLSGNIPSGLSNSTFCELLDLSNNQLDGNIPPEFGNLTFGDNGSLNLSNNQLSGNIPPELGSMSSIGDYPSGLNLSHNKLNGHIPPELGLYFIARLDLSYNELSGRIPPELGNLAAYHSNLNLSNNQLNGEIPHELRRFSSLDLSHNQLSGNIPASLFHDAYSLRLSYNKLEGPIPEEIGNSYFLELHLDHNKLSGTIPAELTRLTDLHFLFLDHNRFSGAIPPSMADLKRLDSLDLSHNKFIFDGLESVAQTFPFAKYNRQALIPIHINDNTLSVSAGGTLSNNIYQWYKLGEPGNTTITGDSVFHTTKSGVYFVKVRNKVVKSLNLVSKPVRYTAPTTLNAIVSNKQQELLNNSFSVYPNPAKDILHIQTNGKASFSLVSEEGKILLTSNVDKAGAINISNLASGVYYLKNNNTNVTKKISVVK